LPEIDQGRKGIGDGKRNFPDIRGGHLRKDNSSTKKKRRALTWISERQRGGKIRGLLRLQMDRWLLLDITTY